MNNDDHTRVLQTLQESNATLIERLMTQVITCKEDQVCVQDNVILIRGNMDKVTMVKKGLLEPLNEGIRRINSLFNPLLNNMQEAEKAGTQKLSEWRISEQLRNESELNHYYETYQAKVSEAKQTGEVVQLAPLPNINQPRTEHSNAGALNYSDDWDILVPHPELVPREYCEPSLRKLRNAVKAGNRYIDGCIIKQKYVIRRVAQK